MNGAPLILLDAYAAQRCPRRIHNEWDPALQTPQWETPAELQMRLDAGVAFASQVFAQLRQALPESVDLSNLPDRSARIAATLEAMSTDAVMILGGSLPDDADGGRTGQPDLLLRVAEGAYVPGVVKAHTVFSPRRPGPLRYSLLHDPNTIRTTQEYGLRTLLRQDDHLQLAHYWRMLQALGFAPTTAAVGFVIGKDIPEELAPGHVLAWLDLDDPLFRSFSRSQGRAMRSALEMYHHEAAFRMKVARMSLSG